METKQAKPPTPSEIKKNKIKGDNNQIIINQAPAVEHVNFFELFRAEQAERKKVEQLNHLLQTRIEMQTQELERLRGHISTKDNYINNLLFKIAPLPPCPPPSTPN